MVSAAWGGGWACCACVGLGWGVGVAGVDLLLLSGGVVGAVCARGVGGEGGLGVAPGWRGAGVGVGGAVVFLVGVAREGGWGCAGIARGAGVFLAGVLWGAGGSRVCCLVRGRGVLGKRRHPLYS